MRRFVLWTLISCCVLSTASADDDRVPAEPSTETDSAVFAPYEAAAVKRWETTIAALERLDVEQSHPEEAILFVGSSSIRLWETLAQDMHPYPTIRRGYGGAKFSDLAVFAERLIQPHRYGALVLFVANDVSGGDDDRTPEEVTELLEYVIGVSRRHQPEAPVFVLEITPTERRWDVWPQIRDVNSAMRQLCLTTPHTYFVPTADYFLDPQKQPRPELFREDKLHLTHDGYKVWTKLLKRRFEEVLQ
ncbi:GDSL-type esterase/lipase family protein [Roseimaritima sediminicola]|uniref:GDSL-type esterase/lipase family protein n=1 Tax=Roseimaritima sediminicola TaxID=2662066 RepID=UPI0012984BDF|nr:GDSL-type esterase/lipase family protein [Roseimaritima sediminicola]